VMLRLFARRQAHVNVSVLYQFVDSATQPWPTSVAPRRGFLSRSGSAWPGRSQKDGLPSCRGECGQLCGSRPSTRAQGRGSLVAAPSNRGRKWTPSRAISLCSPSCRCPAQSPPGRGIETFLARCFLPSVQSQCSVRPMGSGADMDKDYLTLKRASASRPSGEWSEDDYDVLCEGAGVGRIMKAAAAPVGQPWLWTLAHGHQEDRSPIHGYEPTREAAMAAFAKSWRRE